MVAVLDGIISALDGGGAADSAGAIAASLKSGRRVGLFVGNCALQAIDAAQLHVRVQTIADRLSQLNPEASVRFGFFGEAANGVGAALAGAMPAQGGRNARQMIEAPLKAYLVLNAEPEFDMADGALARKSLAAAEMTVVLTPFRQSLDYADVLLPVAPFTETGGTFVNAAGMAQSFAGVVRPLGEARPAWKVLRVLGNLLELDGFAQDTVEAVRAECLPANLAARLDNRTGVVAAAVPARCGVGFERVADVPIYFADALVRRANSLRQTADARPPRARMNSADLARLGVTAGNKVRIANGESELVIAAIADDGVAAGCIRLSAGHVSTIDAGSLAGRLRVKCA